MKDRKSSPIKALQKILLLLIFFVIAITFFIHTLNPTFHSRLCLVHHISLPVYSLFNNNNSNNISELQHPNISSAPSRDDNITRSPEKTALKHIVFGIASSARLWFHRKNYVRQWWNPHEMRGYVWLDKPLPKPSVLSTNVTVNDTDSISKPENYDDDDDDDESDDLPPLRISEDTSRFPYLHRGGHRSGIRISRILSESLRLGLKDVRWFVMGDDDTYFVADNLVRVLSKYDHEQYYYIGSVSESHTQNIAFSYGMAYGGGGFAISYGLAEAIARINDECIERYPELYGSDDRMHACMTELGVPLTKEPGFHQFDVYGSVFGLLAAHPVAPLVTMHHLDIVAPIFPRMTRVQALQHLTVPTKLDSAALMQQSICYHKPNNWTISVSWGYAVQLVRGHIRPREMETPSRTFLNWYRNADPSGFAFNTRSLAPHYCQRPFVFYMSNATFDSSLNTTVSVYARRNKLHPKCEWTMKDPDGVATVVVYKSPDPLMWDKAPRRNCCRVMPSSNEQTMQIHVGACEANETIEDM